MSYSMYSVNAFIGAHFLFQSDYFATKEEAINLLNYLKNNNTGILEFQLYKSYPRGKRVTNNNSITEEDFSDMTFEDYGKGYLLRPAEGDIRTGTKYFYEGFWMPKCDAWFFQSELYDFLVSMRAEYIYGSAPASESLRFDNMTVTNHGKGLFMTTETNNSLYGHNINVNVPDHIGYWNPTLHGWILRMSSLDYLINNGAIYIGFELVEDMNTSEDEDTTDEGEFSGMTVTSHGRGYLLHPNGDSRSGEKYFFEGFWMPKYSAWFFKTDHYDTLIDCRATSA